jgi:hypothetical protein
MVNDFGMVAQSYVRRKNDEVDPSRDRDHILRFRILAGKVAHRIALERTAGIGLLRRTSSASGSPPHACIRTVLPDDSTLERSLKR